MQLTVASPQMQAYFDALDAELRKNYAIATTAREKGFDPEDKVDIKLAKNMAERVEALISVVAPQIIGCGIIKRISELEKKYGHLDWRVALCIALEVSKQKFCKFKDRKEALEIGIRTGFAYQTGGIVAAPLEGFIELKIKSTNDGKEYLAPRYAGPIRGAGGTAAAFSLLLVDYVRINHGFAKYDPSDAEISRLKTEVLDYHDRVTNLQYLPSGEELDFLAKHLPIEVDGEATEKIEVSNYKDLPRIDTNNIRGGICLVMAEGLAQKAPKLWKRLEKWGKEFGFEWDFLGEFLKLQKQIKAKRSAQTSEKKEKLSPNYTFIADLVAGRPVLTHPMAHGGLRLRYGRSRISGFSAASINPLTMYVLKKYIAIGTQLKIERPGKAAAITPCDTIEGPIVKLDDGSVMLVENLEQAKSILPRITTILFLGDILINYGDFSENGHILVPCGYNEEWWLRDIEKRCVDLFGTIDYDKLSGYVGFDAEKIINIFKDPMHNKLTADEAVLFSRKLAVPLHPFYTYHWNILKPQELGALINAWKEAKCVLDDNGVLIKAVMRSTDAIKVSLENIGCPHFLVSNEFIVLSRPQAQIFHSLLSGVDIANVNASQTASDNLSVFSGIKIKDKSGTFIGARMGRPEKAKMRKMTGSPQVLFPVGDEGGRTRSFQSAIEAGKVNADICLLYCPKCKKETVYRVCETCSTKAQQLYFCRKCGKTDKPSCPQCKGEELQKYDNKNIDIKYYFDDAIKRFGEPTSPDLVKGVRGTSNKDHIPEHIIKGLLRAKHNIYVNKDGTIRFDMSELPITHFTPAEISTPIETLNLLGYTKDIHGKEVVSPDQVFEIKPQDLILPGAKEGVEDPANDILFRVANFVDELLVKLYSLEPYYNLKSKQELVGHLVIALAPHISSGMIGRIIGFSRTQGMFAHPMFHAALRRDCDGDEASVSLLMDGFLNFSSKFLPDTRGAKTMDAPLVLTSLLNPAEVDDQAHGVDVVWQYPLELYEAAEQYKFPWDVKIEQIKNRLGTELQYEQMGFTHNISNINKGVLFSAYKALPSMEEKLDGQMEIASMLRAVDAKHVAEMVITKHFLKDTKGNLRKFSQQQFRCVKCNDKFRRPPLRGVCTKCGGKIIFTISEGSVLKYMNLSVKLATEYDVAPYVKQTLVLLRNRINSVFGKEKEKQEGLARWF